MWPFGPLVSVYIHVYNLIDFENGVFILADVPHVNIKQKGRPCTINVIKSLMKM